MAKKPKSNVMAAIFKPVIEAVEAGREQELRRLVGDLKYPGGDKKTVGELLELVLDFLLPGQPTKE